eukprot:2508531-Rhodomonas_salina.4
MMPVDSEWPGDTADGERELTGEGGGRLHARIAVRFRCTCGLPLDSDARAPEPPGEGEPEGGPLRVQG